ncbi:MAG: hypothetical protein WAL38_29720, partial [Solirubrobacteraceae bacterium]
FCTPIVDSSKFPALGLDGGGGGTMSFGVLLKKDASGGIGTWNGLVPAERMVPLFGAFDEESRPDQINGVWGQGTLLQTSKPTAYVLHPGEIMRIQTACAAGYGDPLERDPAAVLDDVANELVSLHAAAELYGVKIDAERLELDADGTAALREQMRAERTADWATPLAHPFEWPLDESEFERLRQAGVVGSNQQVHTEV